MLALNNTSVLALGKVLLGVAALIVGVSYAFAGGELWQLITAAAAVVFGVVFLISGARDLTDRRRDRLKARDEERRNE